MFRSSLLLFLLTFLSVTGSAQDPLKRKSPPSPTELGKLQENLKFVYKSDYDKINGLSGNATQQKYARMVLSRKLWDNAKKLNPSDSGFYPTLYEVMRLSVLTQRPKPALEAIDLLEKFYSVDSSRMRTIVFENAIKKVVRLDDVKAASEYLNRAIQIAVLTDQLEDAKKLVVSGEAIAKRVLSNKLKSEVASMGNVVDELLEQKFQAGASQRKIDGGTATQSDYMNVALYAGLRKNNWSDAEIAAGELADDKLRGMFVKEILAERDLATTIELANGWWDFASSKTGSVKAQAIELAAFRYAVSISKLEGFNKQIAESRLKLVNKQLLLTRLWQAKDYGNLGFLWEGAFDTAPGFLTNGLIAYYPFNGNAKDESGNGNDATLKNGARFGTDRSGNQRQALELDGVDDFAEAPHRQYLNFPNGDFTLSCWAKILDRDGFTLIVKSMGPGSTSKWSFTNNEPAEGLGFHINPGGHWLATKKIASGDFLNLVFTKKGTKYVQYRDGQAVVFEEGPISIPQSNNAPLHIGETEGGWHFKGSIDDIRIYNRSLSAEEVKQLYEFEK